MNPADGSGDGALTADVHTILQLTQVGVWQWWPETKRFLADERLRAITGMTDEQIATFTFEKWASRLHPADRAVVLRRREESLDTGRFECVYRFHCEDGTWRWLLDRSTVAQRDALGQPVCVVGVVEDVTDQQRQYRVWKRLEQTLPGILYSLKLDVDGTRQYQFMSHHAFDLYGATPDAIKADASLVDRAIHPDDLPLLLRTMRKATSTQIEQSCEYRVGPADQPQWVEDKMSPDLAPDGQVFLHGVIVQITHRKELEFKLRHLSNTDELTGLYNRRFLRETLEAQSTLLARSGEPYSLIALDFDYFKLINDQHGHSVGDEVLASLAIVLKSVLRDKDVAGRTGGEEFLLVLPQTRPDEALKIAETIREGVARLVYKGSSQESFHVTISVGVAGASNPLEEYESVWKRADRALYMAKRAGRNCIRSC